MLCHPGSFSEKDPVRDVIPTPGKPLPIPYCGSKDDSFVRADVVYLRQDFSVLQPVKDAKPWPEMQRNDYVVRRAVLTKEEAAEWAKQHESDDQKRRSYVAAALSYLTQLDAAPKPRERAKYLMNLRRTP
jgi:hypothetical protein